jgi:hypothetical protein
MNLVMIAFSFFFLSTAAHAFPEMIRHNYPNCTSCHVSPNGGGLLNEYGRQSSAAALSTWGSETEAKAVYGLLKQPEWLDTTALVRAVQTFQDNSKVSSGNFWWMEGDLEGAARFGKDQKWTADLALGVSPDALNQLLPENASPIVSARHYLLYHPTESTSIRAGKFLTDYGIYFPEHTIATRQGIGFDAGAETYNLEYSLQGETWSGSITANFGRPDDSSLLMEKGMAAKAGYTFLDHHQVGLSAYAGAQNGTSRQLVGPFGLFGFSTSLYALAEADFQFLQTGAISNAGFFSYEKIGYEPIRGFHVYVMEQTFVHAFQGRAVGLAQNLKYGPTVNRMIGVGPGLIWYPRPHFYFKFEVQDQFSVELPSSQLSGYLTSNFYL